MNVYNPDRWLIVNITTNEGESIFKVFGTWLGGYPNGDWWRMSSGITKIEDAGDRYIILNASGSEYIVFKGCEGTSNWSSSVLQGLKDKCVEYKGNLEVVDIESIGMINV